MSGLERTREALRIGERDTTAWDAAWAEVERAEAVIQAAREIAALEAEDAQLGTRWFAREDKAQKALAAALRALDEDTA